MNAITVIIVLSSAVFATEAKLSTCLIGDECDNFLSLFGDSMKQNSINLESNTFMVSPENTKNVFSLDDGTPFKISLYRLKKNYVYYAYYRQEDAYKLAKSDLDLKAGLIQVFPIEIYDLGKYENRVMKIVLKGIKQFSEFLLFFGFDSNYKKFFLVFQNYTQTNTRIEFKKFNTIIKQYISECITQSKEQIVNMLTLMDVEIIAEYKEKNNNFVVFMIVAPKDAKKMLYIELNLFEVRVIKWSYITVSNLDKENNVRIKYFKDYINIITSDIHHLVPTEMFLAEVDDFKIDKYTIKFDIDIANIMYLSQGNFVINSSNTYHVYSVSFTGSNLSKFIKARSIDSNNCKGTFHHIYTEDYFGCVVRENGYFNFYLYYVVNKYQGMNVTYKVMTNNKFKFSENFVYKEDFFKRFIILVFEGTVVTIFYNNIMNQQEIEQNTASVDLIDAHNQILEFSVFNHINQDVDVLNYFGRDFVQIDIMNSGTNKFSNDKYTKYTKIIDKVITNITDLIGFAISDDDTVPINSVIISNKYRNFFFENSKAEKKLGIKKGILINEAIKRQSYFMDNLFIEFENVFGFFNFKKSNNFIEVKVRPSDFELFLPINIDSGLIMYLTMDTDKLQIITSNSIVYTKYLTEFNIKIEFPILKFTYDEFYPNYIYIMDKGKKLLTIEIIYTKFIYVELYFITHEINFNNLFYLRNYGPKLIFIYSQTSDESIVNSSNVLKIIRVNTASSLNYEELNNKVIPYSFCRYFETQLLISRKKERYHFENFAGLVICLRNFVNNHDVLYFINLTHNDKQVPIYLSTEIISKLKDTKNSKAGIMRIKSVKNLEDALIILSIDKNSGKSQLDIIKIRNKPVLRLEIQNSNDFNDNHESYVIQKFFGKPQTVTTIKINTDCFVPISDEITKKMFKNDEIKGHFNEDQADQLEESYKITQNNLKTTIRIQPQRLFDGNIHIYKHRLNDQLENFYKIMEVKSLARLVTEMTINIPECPLTGSSCLKVINPTHMVMSDNKQSMYRLYKFHSLHTYKTYPESHKYKGVFYAENNTYIIITNSNDLYAHKLGNEMKFLLNLNFSFYCAELGTYGGIKLLKIKTDPQYDYFNRALFIKEIDSEIRVLNPHNYHIKLKTFSFLQMCKKTQALVHLKEPMVISFFSIDDARKFEPLFNQGIDLKDYIVNKEVQDFYTEAFRNASIKCSVFIQLSDTDVVFGCLMVFAHADSLLININFRAGKYSLTSIYRMTSVYYTHNFDIKNHGALLSSKYAATYYILNDKLYVYIYQIASYNFHREALLPEYSYDFCSQSSSPQYINSSMNLKILLEDASLQDVYMDKKYLIIVTSKKLYRYTLHKKFRINLLKTNLNSQTLKISAENKVDKKIYDITLDEVRTFNICKLTSV